MYFATVIDAKNAIMIRDADCQHTSMIVADIDDTMSDLDSFIKTRR